MNQKSAICLLSTTLIFLFSPSFVHGEPEASLKQRANGYGAFDKQLHVGARYDLVVTRFGNPPADEEVAFKRGFAVGGFGNLRVLEQLRLQIELLYITKGSDIESDGSRIGELALAYLEIPILVQIEFPQYRRFRPYGYAGPGLGILLSARNRDRLGNDFDIEDFIKPLDWGVIIGAGSAVSLTSGFELIFEGRYEHGLVIVENTDIPGSDNFKNRALSFALGLRWGRVPDRDDDGIPDGIDRCPEEKEDADGWDDHDGCPDLDNDSDGLADKADKCPNQAEDKDGFEDTDGCPDEDNDKDGLADNDDQCPDEAEDKDQFDDTDGCPDEDNDGDELADRDDKCPNEAEDKDGFEDGDGCPDADNDRDGIADNNDTCPDAPENKNGFEDDDGCPDKDYDGDGVPDKLDKCRKAWAATANGCARSFTHVKITKSYVRLVKPLGFAKAGAALKLSRAYKKRLDRLGRALAHYTGIKKVRIKGYVPTDSAADRELGEKRLQAVRDYLIKNMGVKGKRLAPDVTVEVAKKKSKANQMNEIELVIEELGHDFSEPASDSSR